VRCQAVTLATGEVCALSLIDRVVNGQRTAAVARRNEAVKRGLPPDACLCEAHMSEWFRWFQAQRSAS
jgi:hypothetical protein